MPLNFCPPVQPKSLGQALLTAVWKHLSLTECDYFGLEFQDAPSRWVRAWACVGTGAWPWHSGHGPGTGGQWVGTAVSRPCRGPRPRTISGPGHNLTCMQPSGVAPGLGWEARGRGHPQVCAVVSTRAKTLHHGMAVAGHLGPRWPSAAWLPGQSCTQTCSNQACFLPSFPVRFGLNLRSPSQGSCEVSPSRGSDLKSVPGSAPPEGAMVVPVRGSV